MTSEEGSSFVDDDDDDDDGLTRERRCFLLLLDGDEGLTSDVAKIFNVIDGADEGDEERFFFEVRRRFESRSYRVSINEKKRCFS